jgi:hypothetical protein
MKIRHVFAGAAVATSVVLTIIGMFKGAAVLIGLATVIELIASAITGKQANT